MKGDLRKMKRILLVIAAFICYYGTKVERLFWRFGLDKNFSGAEK
jgi:hypothetical protein